MNDKVVYDPVELVEDLADKIGIRQLYAIAKSLHEKCNDVENDNNTLRKKMEEQKYYIQHLEKDNAMMQGEINGLRFALRCDGVSGGEVNA